VAPRAVIALARRLLTFSVATGGGERVVIEALAD